MLICMAWHRHWHLEIGTNYKFWRLFRSSRSNRGNGMGKRDILLRRITFATWQEKTGTMFGFTTHGKGAQQKKTLAA